MNYAFIVGHLGRDAEVSQLQNGTLRLRLTVATSERGFQLPDGTISPERTTWHTVTAWGGLAKACANLKKGDLVAVAGTYEGSSYETREGQKATFFELKARNIQFILPRAHASER